MEGFGLSDLVALLIGLAIFVALGYLITYRAAIYHFLMSHLFILRPTNSPEQVVHVPVGGTGASGTALIEQVVQIRDTTAPEGDTEAWEMPRLSRHNTDRERVIYLASQRTPEGKYRYSANQIVTLQGGSRADVLALVRQ